MIRMKGILLLLLWLTGFHQTSSRSESSLAKRLIYRSIASHSMGYCVQLVTGSSTEPIGCQTLPGGNRGPVRWMTNSTGQALQDQKWSSADDNKDFVAIVSAEAFASQWRENFTDWRNNRITGVIVLHSPGASANLSIDRLSHCDRQTDGTIGDCIDGLFGVTARLSIPFPVVLVSANTLKAVTGKSVEKLRQLPNLWAGLYFGYSGLTNSRSCRRRQETMHSAALGRFITGELLADTSTLCDALAEESLAWTVTQLPRSFERASASVLLIIVRLDSFSVFTNWHSGPGQLHASLSVAIALTASLADLARKTASPQTAWSSRDIAVLFLAGESYANLASRRLADELLSGGILGRKGEPAAVKAQHLHTILEIGPLTGGGRAAGLRSVSSGSAAPVGSSLGILLPAVRPPARGLLLTSANASSSAALTPSSLQTLVGLSANFLSTGSAEASSGATTGVDDGSTAARLAEIVACFSRQTDGGVASCDPLVGDRSVLFINGQLHLARCLRRWKSGVGLSASPGPDGSIQTSSGAAQWERNPLGTRLLAESLLLRYTLANDSAAAADCPRLAKDDDSTPVRGYQVLHGDKQQCKFSSLTSFRLGSYGPADSLADWSISVQDAQPRLVLFASASQTMQWILLAAGAILALLWTHLTAAATVHFLELKVKGNKEVAV